MELFEHIWRENNTVILVTHEEEIAQHARRIIRIRDGRIESDMPTDSRVVVPSGEYR
jgi:putative ABC transport system ATP-binding protein